MRGWEMERWIGVVGALLVGGSALPALLGTVELLLPWPLWTGLFVVVFVVLLVLWRVEENKRLQQVVYTVLVPLSWVVVLTAPEATLRGGLSTIFVAIAATGVYIFRLPINLLTAFANTVVGVVAIDLIVADVLLIVGAGTFFLLLQLSLIFVFHMLRREQQLRAELAEAYIARQTAEAILSETARSAERLHIARELHDVLGHQLTLLNLKLEAAKYQRGSGPDPHLEEAQAVARSLLGDVRATVSDLRTSQISTLADTLRDLGENIPDLEVTVEVSGDLNIDEEQQIALLRSVQEIVTNTLRHAGAEELSILIEGDTQRITLSAGDDGTGSTPVVPGNGLQGLSERFARIGGGIEFAGEQGFHVRAWMPTR